MVSMPSRRTFIQWASMGTWAAVLGACAQPAPPAPTAAAPAAKPGEAPKPAAGASPAAAPAGKPQAAPAQQAGTITLKMQSGFGAKDFLHEQLPDWAKKVDEMSGGRLKIDALPAGAVVGAFDMIDAVHQGTLDGALGVPAYWFGKTKAFSLFGTGAPLGMDAWMMLGWVHYGGGQQLYSELLQQNLKLNVVSYFAGPMVSQPLGWFKDEIKSADDFKGLKFRTVGMAQQVYEGMGATVLALAGPDVIPGLERGVIDAAEFNNPTSDKVNGFPDVRKTYMVGSYHQQSEFLEYLFNKAKFDGLPKDLQAILRFGVMAQSSDYDWQSQDRHSKDFQDFKEKMGVKVVRTPNAILEAQVRLWDQINQRESGADPFFAKVLKSQQEWAQRVVSMRAVMASDAPNSISAKHWIKGLA